MTTQNLEPAVLESIKNGAEQVVVQTRDGWRLGIRSQGVYAIGSALGRMTISEDNQVFHSMIGSVPTYSRQEALDRISALQQEIDEIEQVLGRMP